MAKSSLIFGIIIIIFLIGFTVWFINHHVNKLSKDEREGTKNRTYTTLLISVLIMGVISLLFWPFWKSYDNKHANLINYTTFMLAFFSVVFSLLFNSLELSKLEKIKS